ncbi:UDP-2,4-diacetamido-2,4,6-trideoxy-beta-L-altropyranose hydrolase [Desulfovibrio litoralis]|uniref:UDP-2,4-diacetamido-2,4,6-trideoxy-beta-L-altropyranose hydrolase n=1 Tax=Desulfovibrio litoralis DSM 11393 TaxID=1121455 RepID=A0A1M7SAD0_9BACT|nr:UDP-2,4-diacetamido-2,4,6-trideoxy-beta-L-altropyranose hydrolase [Desulfovibrio litoralis]SHN55539.1 UDP-2,4-diacetamido-2,4,6-trideoxy-beta-L-altropyranose hydrolase [Desulfovibrio litoralis DSM 11393]
MNKYSSDDILVLRADANTQIGTGHVMRCLALAAAWENPKKVFFVTAQATEAFKKRIQDAGYNFVDLEAPHPALPDLALMREILKQDHAYVVLDGYHFDTEYQEIIRKLAGRCLIIDDYNHLNRYITDVLLNQNIGSSDLNYNCNPGCKLLLGAKNALLRPEFLEILNKRLRIIKNEAKNILITMGGADNSNLTLDVLKNLEKSKQTFEIRVILGPSNPHIKSISEFTASSKHHYTILQNVNNMLEQMLWADLAVSAGGSTCWELCYTGLPFLVASVAENQDQLVKTLADRKIAIKWKEAKEIPDLITSLSDNPELRQDMSHKGQALIDGLGVYRAISALRGEEGHLLPATLQYCKQLWPIGNDQRARAMSVMPIPKDFESFEKWFENKVLEKDQPLFFLETPTKEVIGYVSFEKFSQTQEPTLTLCLAQQWRGKGLGILLLQYGCQAFFRTVKSAKSLDALLPANSGSVYSLFVKKGFEKVDTIKCGDNEVYVMRLTRDRLI